MEERALLNKLSEWKNPIVIFCFGTLIGATFYFQNIKSTILILLCSIILISFLFLKDGKIILFIISIILGYIYCINYTKYLTENLDQFSNSRNIYIGEIKSKAINNRFYKTYDLKLKTIHSLKSKWKTNNSLIQVTGSKYEEYAPGDLVQLTG